MHTPRCAEKMEVMGEGDRGEGLRGEERSQLVSVALGEFIPVRILGCD